MLCVMPVGDFEMVLVFADFGLDSYKLEKLRSVEMSFGKWQQAFSPYKSFVSNAGE